MIELKNVSKLYKLKKGKKVLALDNISVKFPNKGMIFITGQSGSGKSTLLNLLGLLDKPSSGELLINDKPTKKLKSKETDFYRNTYIGFIFQDYNLLDNLNVYKNIELTIDLQKKHITKNELDNTLNIVGLDGLGNRKISELSGGQRQRVAIGRAIVKNPDIILADEPTGNLDVENSKQIFNILKQISNHKLVIVVTHNIELAQSYADRIVEIENGNIKNDTIINEIEFDNTNNVKIIKSHLSLLKSMELSIYNLKNKKLRLVAMILILTITLSVFGFFSSLTKFDTNKTHAETMIEQQESKITINKKVKGQNFTTASPVITFTNSEVDEVSNKLNKKITKVSKAVENNEYLEFNFASTLPDTKDKNNYSYYDLSLDKTLFLEYNQKDLLNLKIIGKIPQNKNEIVINKILADYIIKKGISIWKLDEKNNYVVDNYYPQNYEELVTSNKQIVFGSSYLIISGIIDEDLTKYEQLKTTLSDEMIINETKLYDEFKTKYSKSLYEVIVSDSFFEQMDLKPNNFLDMNLYKSAYLINDNRIYVEESLTQILNKEIEVYNGSTFSKINTLGDNQVIFGTYMLDKLFDNEYSEKYLKYMEDLKTNYEQKVKEREEKIKQINEKILEDPEYIYEYPEEIQVPDYEKELRNFTIKYINEKNIIGSKMSLELNDLYLRNHDQKTNIIDNIEVVGICIDDIVNYFPEKILKNYMRDNKETISIYFNEENKEELEHIFNEFPNSNSKFVSETVFTKTINDVSKVVSKISTIALYFSIGFLALAIILFMFFTISSIKLNKKNIGILRALGAKVTDIYKIFYLENFLMGMFAFAFSSIITYISCGVANNLISKNLFLNIKPIIFRVELIYEMFGIIILIMTISFILPIFKIAKTKPIETINVQ